MAVRGRFASSRFPYVPIRIDLRGRTYEVDALLDTGFDGYAALPLHRIPATEAPDGHVSGQLADGSVLPLPYYRAAVLTVADLGSFPAAVVAMGDEPLVGRAVSDRFMVILDPGRQLVIEL